MSKHTPGPLFVKQNEKPPFELSIVNDRGDLVHSEHPWAFSTEQRTLAQHRESMGFSKSSHRQEAIEGNARQLADLHLWAAAPDMLAALHKLEWSAESPRYGRMCPACESFQSEGEHEADCFLIAAIAKATGN